jgi:hypothetical protein
MEDSAMKLVYSEGLMQDNKTSVRKLLFYPFESKDAIMIIQMRPPEVFGWAGIDIKVNLPIFGTLTVEEAVTLSEELKEAVEIFKNITSKLD